MQTLLTYLARQWAAYRQAQQGVVFIFVAVVLFVLILSIGVAIDMARSHMVQSKLSSAVDAATLSAGAVASSQDVTTVVNNYFRANFPNNYMGATNVNLNISVRQSDGSIAGPTDPIGEIYVTATATVPTLLMSLGGINSTDVFAEAEVQRGVRADKTLEIALVMDNSGSMGEPAPGTGGAPKVDVLKTIANQFVNELFEGESVSPNIKIGIVPFDHHVNYTESQRSLNQNAFTPDDPELRPFCASCVPSRPAYYEYAAGSEQQQRRWLASVQSLTSTRSNLTYRIGQMRQVGLTDTAEGTKAGYDLLNPAQNGSFGGNSAGSFADGNIIKVAVLMTDGYNEACADWQGSGLPVPPQCITAYQAQDSAQASWCNQMKNRGITIYSVAFNLSAEDDASRAAQIQNLFRSCASKPEYYFESENAAQLLTDYLTIADSLKTLLLTR